ncbi:hypothetical protein D3C87_1688430 [compost metagenome]
MTHCSQEFTFHPRSAFGRIFGDQKLLLLFSQSRNVFSDNVHVSFFVVNQRKNGRTAYQPGPAFGFDGQFQLSGLSPRSAFNGCFEGQFIPGAEQHTFVVTQFLLSVTCCLPE